MEDRSVHSAVFVRYRAAFCLRRGEMPAPAEPPASSEVPAPSQPEEVPAPSESASSSEPEPPASSVPEKENPLIVNGVLKSYDTGKQKDVVLPSGKFTKIDSGCFKNNTTMESVSIPEGVTEIGFAAFSGCYNLKSVQLPKSLIKIGASAFLAVLRCKGRVSGE